MFSYNKPSINSKDVLEVKNVLSSTWLTQGSQINIFENKLKKYFGAKYCLAVSSGTAALHLLAIAYGWGKKDIIITTPITFIASANCVSYVGAKIDLVDIDEQTYNIDTKKLEVKLLEYKKINKSIAAVIVVDYAGQPCNWKKLKILAKKFKFKLINDNCHALGSKYYNSTKYALKYADAVTQSFHAVKNITTGEGGAILTNSKRIYERIKILRTHGVVKTPKLSKKYGPWYYEMVDLGFNYRITDFQCALGVSQLSRINDFVKKRRKLALFYNKSFKGLANVKTPFIEKNNSHSFHLYPILINFKGLKINKKEFYNFFYTNNILLQVHYIPIHHHPYYKNKYYFNKEVLKNSENFYRDAFSLPMYVDLSFSDQKKIIDIFIKYIKLNSIRKI